mgnify:CR=1 FL=1
MNKHTYFHILIQYEQLNGYYTVGFKDSVFLYLDGYVIAKCKNCKDAMVAAIVHHQTNNK